MHIPDAPGSAVIGWYLEELLTLYLTMARRCRQCVQRAACWAPRLWLGLMFLFCFLPSPLSHWRALFLPDLAPSDGEIMGLADAFPFAQMGCLLSSKPSWVTVCKGKADMPS